VRGEKRHATYADLLRPTVAAFDRQSNEGQDPTTIGRRKIDPASDLPGKVFGCMSTSESADTLMLMAASFRPADRRDGSQASTKLNRHLKGVRIVRRDGFSAWSTTSDGHSSDAPAESHLDRRGLSR